VWSRAAGLRSPRTRERRAEWRVGGLHTRESCFGFGVLHVVRGSVSVQHHCGVGSCMAVALSAWWCLPPCWNEICRFVFINRGTFDCCGTLIEHSMAKYRNVEETTWRCSCLRRPQTVATLPKPFPAAIHPPRRRRSAAPKARAGTRTAAASRLHPRIHPPSYLPQ
jgi:hypothetical protein